MTVETGESTAVDSGTEVENAEGATAEGSQETTEAVTTGEESTESTSEKTTETTTEVSEEPKKDTADSEESESEFYFNGQQVQVEVPEDLKSSLNEAGVDVDKVVSELYGKDSDFTLSDETRAPLDEKFGKPLVDTFLSAIKSQNESMVKGAEEAKAAAEQANQQAVEWSNELVGGEENWNALESWAESNLDEAQIESFNRAMESGDKYLQELAIKDLHSKYQNSEGDTNVNLISGDSAANEGAGAPLSAQDYIAEMTSPEFRALKGHDKAKAQAQLDARRRAGMKKGL